MWPWSRIRELERTNANRVTGEQALTPFTPEAAIA